VLPGKRRVNVLMKKGGNELLGYMKQLIEESALLQYPLEPEQNAGIDYLAAYRLVDQKMIDSYARAFVVEDQKKTGIVSYQVKFKE